MPEIVAKVDTKVLDRILATGLEHALRAAVRSAAYDVERLAQTFAPIDTGALRNSIHVSTSWGEGDYQAAVSAARICRPGVQVHPEARPSPPPGGGAVAHIGAAVHYGVFVEFGTSRMAAHPHLRPALEMVAGPFRRSLEALLRRVAE